MLPEIGKTSKKEKMVRIEDPNYESKESKEMGE